VLFLKNPDLQKKEPHTPLQVIRRRLDVDWWWWLYMGEEERR